MKFEQILVGATAIAGFIWLIDIIFFRRTRARLTTNSSNDPILVEYAKSFFPVLLLVLILRSFVAEPFRIPSASMKPTLFEGDFILVNKFNYGLRVPVIGYKLMEINKPKRGDVIVFRHQDGDNSVNQDLIKRVVGLPGDHIAYKDKVLYINNAAVALTGNDIVSDGAHVIAYKQTERLADVKHGIYTYPSQPPKSYPYEDFIVPAESYYVMGDNRDNSKDSRYFAAIADKDIIGRAFLIWWSWEVSNWSDFLKFWNIHVRVDRIGTAI